MAEENLICEYSGLPSLASLLAEQERQEAIKKQTEKFYFTEEDSNSASATQLQD